VARIDSSEVTCYGVEVAEVSVAVKEVWSAAGSITGVDVSIGPISDEVDVLSVDVDEVKTMVGGVVVLAVVSLDVATAPLSTDGAIADRVDDAVEVLITLVDEAGGKLFERTNPLGCTT
jgi:hypothetical protein